MPYEKLEDVPVTQIGPCDLIQGDCLEILRLMPDNCVDSIVTDPPAGIRFMNADFDTPGKGIQSAENWDCFRRAENPNDVGRDNVFGRTSRTAPHSYGESDRGQFVSWLTAIAQELLRVLKPGGHAFVWALPRTGHWTAWAFEDAGFECRDILHHAFSQGMPPCN
jgi:DNA modification methylase